MQLVGGTRHRAHLVEHLAHGDRLEGCELGGVDRQPGGQPVGSEHPEAARHRHRPRPPLLQGGAVEVGVRLPGEDAVGQRRGLGRFDEMHADPARLEGLEQGPESVGVECLGEAIGDRLAHEDMIGDGHRTGAGVVLATGQRRPGRGEQVVGFHTLQMDGPSLPAPGAGHDQRPVEVPPPPGGEHGVGQHGLGQHLGDGGAREHLRHLAEGEAVLGTEGEHHRVVVGRRLQLEVEGDTETLAQGEAEGPVDAAAVGGVHDELRSLCLVEDALDHDPVVGGEGTERGQARPQVGDHLFRHLVRHIGDGNDRGPGCGAVARGQVGLEEGP